MPTESKKSKSKSSRFPVARIKKIMQMDEEVGKLASATPVMISKSLECFLQNLIDECSSSAQSRGSKKITPHHLKSTITSQPNFDFLLSLVENIPDPAPSGTDGGGGTSAKRKRTRKKSTKDDDGYGEDEGGVPAPADSQPKALPQIGTWKSDMEGGGGRGEGGRGMFDDYEEDEDDY